MRFPRLEAILGCAVDSITEAALNNLIVEATDEGDDLDFKRELHTDNQDLASDVAAFANLQGGVIIVGIEEDGHGRAGRLSPQVLSESDELRVRAVVADLVRPYVNVTVHRVASTGDPSKGFLVISIPASRDAPHFVHRGHANLKCPCRDGKRTRYLAESEIADRYRARFAFAQSQADRLRSLVDGGLGQLADDSAWLCVASLPVLRGSFRLGGGGASHLGQWVQPLERELPPLGVPPLWQSGIVGRIGPQRFTIRDGLSGSVAGNPAHHGLLELHTDGSIFGAMAISAGQVQTAASGGNYVTLWDTACTRDVAALLAVGAKHAVDNARTEGDALSRVLLVPASGDSIGFSETYRARQIFPVVTLMSDRLVSDRTIDLSAIYASPSELLVATRQLLEDVVQSFGIAEIATIDEGGVLRLDRLEDHVRGSARTWAESNAVTTVTED